jgi:hypothetical protein
MVLESAREWGTEGAGLGRVGLASVPQEGYP